MEEYGETTTQQGGNTLIPDATVTDIHINTDLIPDYVRDELASILLESVRNYFSVPENMAKFEKWQAEHRELERHLQEDELH